MLRTYPLPFDPSSAAFARRRVEQFATEHHLDGTTQALALIASELVTNAVMHGAEPLGLSLCHEPGEVTVEVFDGDPTLSDVRSPPAHDMMIGGKGLRIVASLADRWGTRASRTGKTVWATVYTQTQSNGSR